VIAGTATERKQPGGTGDGRPSRGSVGVPSGVASLVGMFAVGPLRAVFPHFVTRALVIALAFVLSEGTLILATSSMLTPSVPTADRADDDAGHHFRSRHIRFSLRAGIGRNLVRYRRRWAAWAAAFAAGRLRIARGAVAAL
jgi:hypothetical protein